MERDEIIISAIGVAVLLVIAAMTFRAYLSPSMLIDFANLRLCS